MKLVKSFPSKLKLVKYNLQTFLINVTYVPSETCWRFCICNYAYIFRDINILIWSGFFGTLYSFRTL